MAVASVTGHVKLVERRRGPQWYMKYRLADGRQVQRLLGPAWTERGRPPTGYFTRKTAEHALQAILADARRGTLADAPRSGRTFEDACVEWLRYVRDEKQRAASTLADYCNVMRTYLLPEFGADTPLDRITTERIDAYRERLLGEGRLSPLIDQAARVLDGLSRRELFTGASDLVFCSPLGGYLNDSELRDRFYAALKRARLGRLREKPDPFVFHDLRHTFGTLAVQGWPLRDVQGYMGHADIQTTMLYVHHVPKQDAAERLSQIVEASRGAGELPRTPATMAV